MLTFFAMIAGAMCGIVLFGLTLLSESCSDGTYYQIDGFFDPHFKPDTGEQEGYSGSTATTSRSKWFALVIAHVWWWRRNENNFFTVTVVRYPHGDTSLTGQSKTIWSRKRPYNPADHIKKKEDKVE